MENRNVLPLLHYSTTPLLHYSLFRSSAALDADGAAEYCEALHNWTEHPTVTESATSQHPEASDAAPLADDDARAAALIEAYGRITRQLAKIIVGQEAVIEQLLIAILARGHCLLEGVPGLAKTLMVRCLAQAMDLSFRRIQFTPDLMPADITGTDIIQQDPATGHRQLAFEKGPIFAQMILADEINRTPPKTQAALLEAMQEHSVTIGGRTYTLDEPFFVLATQNPIEQEGTYPLPEAQRDRFLFHVLVDYPEYEQERQIIAKLGQERTLREHTYFQRMQELMGVLIGAFW
jgi:MoxR-like ATPase